MAIRRAAWPPGASRSGRCSSRVLWGYLWAGSVAGAARPAEPPIAMHRHIAAAADGAWYHGYALYADLTSTAMLRSGWNHIPWAQRIFEENELGESPTAAPVRVVAGEADATGPVDGSRRTVARTCKACGPLLVLRSYPGFDDDRTMIQAVPDQIAWISERFAGTPATGSCPIP